MEKIKEEKMKFQIFNDEGKKIECEALFTFESEETKKNYMVYTDNTKDEENNTKVYAATYNPSELNDEATNLDPIETEEEWNTIEEILNKLQDKIEGTSEQ